MRLRAAAHGALEPLEARLLFSTDPQQLVSLEIAAKNPSLLYEPTAAETNSKSEDGLSIQYQQPTRTLQNLQGYLSKPQKGARISIARAFLASHASDLHLTQADVSGAIVTNQYTDAATGVTHIYMNQAIRGVQIVNANLGIHIARGGRVLSVNSSFIPNAAKEIRGTDVKSLSATQALRRGAGRLGLKIHRTLTATVNGEKWTLNAPDVSFDPIPQQKQYMATADAVVPVWTMIVRPPDGSNDWYNLAVSTVDGRMLFASNWSHKASYRAFALPIKSPLDGSRTLIVDPADPTASPFGWHDNDGIAGAEFTDTRGNNVDAHGDVNGNDIPSSRPDGGASLVFDFPFDTSQPPSTYISASTTNLFYLINALHDIHYHYGFDEAAGNFQVNNYGHGGIGDDAVQADDQDGSGFNNANFDTPPDGMAPRMQMFNWFTGLTGSPDATIVAHEFGHGISTRLTGGPANSNSLDAFQSAAMGEGWSDWWALMLTMKSTDSASSGYGIAGYVVGQPNPSGGIRSHPYSLDLSIDPTTYTKYNGVYDNQEPHGGGEIWCSALWDMSWMLIQKYGFDANVYSGYTGTGSAGNKLALQLVMDALKLQATNPSMTQARDAILLADQNLTGGQNQKEIWQAFARRGLGLSAYDGGNGASRAVREAFDVPVQFGDDSYIVAKSPNVTAIQPLSSVSVTFNEAMDTSSFTVVDDVLSFTAPGAVDLKSQISGFTWSGDAKTLTLNFPTQTATGTYSLTLAPTILSADNEHPLDQNRNGVAGDASADQYSTTFAYQPFVGPDSFGYQAGAWTYEDLHLSPGGSGVTSILTNNDDEAATIDLGGNSFSFYGTSYSGANQLFLNPNGQITFGSATSGGASYAHGDLSGYPSQPTIAAMWHDWFTFVDSSDQVLYKFDDTNGDSTPDRLIVEWHDVRDVNTLAPGGVTFQAILQLNTGSQPGTILFNYPDLDGGNLTTQNGNNSTVGIRSASASRVYVSRDPVDNPFFASGKAVRISTDWIAPTASTPVFDYLTQQDLRVSFSEDVSASLSKNDFVLTNTTSSQVISPNDMSLNYNAGSNTATLTFPGLPNGALPDGIYQLSIGSSTVTDRSLNPLSSAVSFNFFALAGDANHDGRVNSFDFGALASHFGQSGQNFAAGDFNYDHVVNALDFNLLASNYGTVLV